MFDHEKITQKYAHKKHYIMRYRIQTVPNTCTKLTLSSLLIKNKSFAQIYIETDVTSPLQAMYQVHMVYKLFVR